MENRKSSTFIQSTLDSKANTLSQLVKKYCTQKYGNHPPEVILSRMERELRSVLEHGFESNYLLAHSLAEAMKASSAPYWFSGTSGCSFLAFLLGITEVNPLPPHYYCSKCGQTEFVSLTQDGFDLPPRQCLCCGSTMHGDGHDLDFAWFAGSDGTKTPCFDEYYTTKKGIAATEKELRKSREITPLMSDDGIFAGWYLSSKNDFKDALWQKIDHPCERGKTLQAIQYDPTRIGNPHILVLQNDMLSALEELSFKTDIALSDIPMDDEHVYDSLWKELQADTVLPYNPLCLVGLYAPGERAENWIHKLWHQYSCNELRFSDLIHIFGVKNGTTDNLHRNFEMRNIFCDRDSVYQYLLKFGLPKTDAFWLADKVRSGKMTEILSIKKSSKKIEHLDLPMWFREEASHIQYLFPRGHAIGYLMNCMRMAWFYHYYQRKFEQQVNKNREG